MGEKYSYSPLESYADEAYPWSTKSPQIRLLHLQPEEGYDRLECSLEVAEPFSMPGSEVPRAHPPYEAISYVWGNPDKSEQILCDGRTLAITASLATGLRRVRLPDRMRLLWADGVCINQDDIKERQRQVPLMAAIYSQAEQVICWFGEDKDDCAKRTFEFATRLCDRLNPYLERQTTDPPVTRTEPGAVKLDFDIDVVISFTDGELERDFASNSYAKDASFVFQNPWFSRVWIRQEVGYASKACALCGKNELDYRSLKLLYFWAVFKKLALKGDAWVSPPSDSFRSSSDFLDVLVAAREFQASDPRDKVYAMLSHPSAYEELPLEKYGLKDHTKQLVNAKGLAEAERAKRTIQALTAIMKEWVTITDSILDKDGNSATDGGSANGPKPGVSRAINSDTEITDEVAMKLKVSHVANQAMRFHELEETRHHPVIRVLGGTRRVFSPPIVEPDYNKTVPEICLEVATALLRRCRDNSRIPAFLCEVQHDPKTPRLDETGPSWVPRWDRDTVHFSLRKPGLASFNPWNGGSYWWYTEGSVLYISGIRVDKISTCTEPLTIEDMGIGSSRLLDFWKSILVSDTTQQRPTSWERAQAYQRTLCAGNSVSGMMANYFEFAGQERILRDFAAFWRSLRETEEKESAKCHRTIFSVPELESIATGGDASNFLHCVYPIASGRKVFYTEKGFLGIGPGILQKGDIVSILPCPVLFVLRPVDGHFLLAGECYVDGIMRGEVTDASKVERLEIH
ncbi:heterokaryon incompatibility protein-domain-containing protein [Lasiosphaeria ovina]|uniref:Heterokaryon incompatibility protein-domain-containing protein n=1 Tax=Lasiosphaeria ovina TaxID=92902 RepID=A0AAE0K3Z4_9PEZI|nr:heterokaryon incompatibility protein-domain-containing protein [Lasiosphaeria ovina]